VNARINISTRPKPIVVNIDGLPNREFRKLRDAYDYLQITADRGIKYWYNVARAAAEAIARRERRSHPPGYFDKAGRFFLTERCECCAEIKTPSRTWPYPEMNHGRTLVHVASVFDVELKHLRQRVRDIDQLDQKLRCAA
jgi:hypothetical protein